MAGGAANFVVRGALPSGAGQPSGTALMVVVGGSVATKGAVVSATAGAVVVASVGGTAGTVDSVGATVPPESTVASLFLSRPAYAATPTTPMSARNATAATTARERAREARANGSGRVGAFEREDAMLPG